LASEKQWRRVDIADKGSPMTLGCDLYLQNTVHIKCFESYQDLKQVAACKKTKESRCKKMLQLS